MREDACVVNFCKVKGKTLDHELTRTISYPHFYVTRFKSSEIPGMRDTTRVNGRPVFSYFRAAFESAVGRSGPTKECPFLLPTRQNISQY